MRTAYAEAAAFGSSAVDRVAIELDGLEKVQADLAGITLRSDTGRRADLIEFRRRLSHQIARLGEIVEPLLTDPEERGEYRRRFSAMRSTAALHQAEWPAVLLGHDDAAYLKSAMGVREKNRAFVGWLRATLPAIGRAR